MKSVLLQLKEDAIRRGLELLNSIVLSPSRIAVFQFIENLAEDSWVRGGSQLLELADAKIHIRTRHERLTLNQPYGLASGR